MLGASMTMTAFMYYWLEENKRYHKAQMEAFRQGAILAFQPPPQQEEAPEEQPQTMLPPSPLPMRQEQQSQEQQSQPQEEEEEEQSQSRQYPQVEDSDSSEDCEHCNYQGPEPLYQNPQFRSALVVAFYFTILMLFNVYLAGLASR
jgi:hypothetical protein